MNNLKKNELFQKKLNKIKPQFVLSINFFFFKF